MLNTVLLLLNNGRRIYTTEQIVEDWLNTRKNLHLEGDYLVETTEKTEVIFNEKAIKDIIKILNEDTPAASALRTIVNECADTAYMCYPIDSMWEEKLKHIATKGCGYNMFPELVAYKTTKKVTKAKIIKL